MGLLVPVREKCSATVSCTSVCFSLATVYLELHLCFSFSVFAASRTKKKNCNLMQHVQACAAAAVVTDGTICPLISDRQHSTESSTSSLFMSKFSAEDETSARMLSCLLSHSLNVHQEKLFAGLLLMKKIQ